MIKQLATEWVKNKILVARIPLGRFCEPTDLATLAIYVVAPASDFIIGQIIFADGGLTATQ